MAEVRGCMLQPSHCTGKQPQGHMPCKGKANVKGKSQFWRAVYAHHSRHGGGLRLPLSLQRTPEVHDYKQQLHEQLGYVQVDASLDTAFYPKGTVVCLLYLVTVFPDFLFVCCGSSSVSAEVVEVNAMSPHHLSALGNFHPDVSTAQLMPILPVQPERTLPAEQPGYSTRKNTFPPTCKFNFELLEIDIAVQHYKL